MTREEFEDYLVLNDTFNNKCNLIASIFSEVDNDFIYADGWMVHMPYETCTGCKKEGYIFCISPSYKLIHIPYKYIYMTEDELKKVVKEHPEEVKLMINNEDDLEDIFDDDEDYLFNSGSDDKD